MTLNELRRGQCAVVESVDAASRVKRRMVEMGLTPGVTVCLRKRAPLGDPIEISLRGYALTLRAADAQCVFVLPKPSHHDAPTSAEGPYGRPKGAGISWK